MDGIKSFSQMGNIYNIDIVERKYIIWFCIKNILPPCNFCDT